MSSTTVYLTHSRSPLIHDLQGCAVSPDACAGVVAASAWGRWAARTRLNQTTSTEQQQPANLLELHLMDILSLFVQMYPTDWQVNVLVLRDIMKLPVALCSQVLFIQDARDFDVSQKDLRGMQVPDWPVLVTNVNLPPSNSWAPYQIPVYFDATTRLAVLYIDSALHEPVDWPDIFTAQNQLSYIAKLNNNSNNDKKWIPVVYYYKSDEQLDKFVEAMQSFAHPPALIVHTISSLEPLPPAPEKVTTDTGTDIYITRHTINTQQVLHHELTFTEGGNLTNVAFLQTNNPSSQLPQDTTCVDQVGRMQLLAADALTNNPKFGSVSADVPVHRTSNDLVRCMQGECEIGNLMADAFAWHAAASLTNVDVAFLTSGGIQGPGWPAGPVQLSDIWTAFPYPNTDCTGVASGLLLYKIFEYAVRSATFTGYLDGPGAWKLLQVSSGVRMTYNSQLQDRLVSLDIYDASTSSFQPIERTKLYIFATDSFVCSQYEPLVNHKFTFPGEEPPQIGLTYVQTITAHYLDELGRPYDPKLEGRLVDDVNATDVLNMAVGKEDCENGEIWDSAFLDCVKCIEARNVMFAQDSISFSQIQGSSKLERATIAVINLELSSVVLSPRSIPEWVTLFSLEMSEGTNATMQQTEGVPDVFSLPAGQRVAIDIAVGSSELSGGTFQSPITFEVSFVESTDCERDISVEATLQVTPQTEMNYLGSWRIYGFILLGIVVVTAVMCAVWVILKRKLRVVKTMQPIFLITICGGVFVMASAIVPLSIDDEIASDRGCDIACMATPWLASFGFTITFAAIFSKLWRVNRLFQASRNYRRVKVTERDVLKPFAVLLILNFTLLLVWTLVDPLQWNREPVQSDEEWNTAGKCESETFAGPLLMALVLVVAFCALLLALYQAWKARDVPQEFSESKYIGIGVFMWLELLVVGLPVAGMIRGVDTTAFYIVIVGLLFAVACSMLVLVFFPIVLNWRRSGNQRPTAATVRVTGIDQPTNASHHGPIVIRNSSPYNSGNELPANDLSEIRTGAAVKQQAYNEIPAKDSSEINAETASAVAKQQGYNETPAHDSSEIRTENAVKQQAYDSYSENDSSEIRTEATVNQQVYNETPANDSSEIRTETGVKQQAYDSCSENDSSEIRRPQSSRSLNETSSSPHALDA